MAGRCVAAISAARGAGTSAQNTSWRLSGAMIDVRDDRAAVGVGSQHDGSLDRADEVAHGGDHGDIRPAQRADHAVQLPESANAPWTSTTVGFMGTPFGGGRSTALRTGCSVVP